MSWPFLDHEGRVASLFLGDVVKSSEESAGVERGKWFIRGTERPDALFIRWRGLGRCIYHFHRGERDARALGVATRGRVTCN